jgi:hypothetical protein
LLWWSVAAAAVTLVLWRVARFGEPAFARSSAVQVSPLGPGAALLIDDTEVRSSRQVSISPGQAIETPMDGGASVKLATGTELELGPASNVRVHSAGTTERFSLARGRLSVHVVELLSGQRFIVDTPDAQIEVRGTRFALNVLSQAESCGNGTRTRLVVSEGVVEVRSSGVVERVNAGQAWPADCSAPTAQAAPAPSAARAVAATPAVVASTPAVAVPSAAARAPHGALAATTSSLSRQNDLFAAAVALRQRGDVPAALRAYQELIVRFPRSPLAQDAMVERIRLLALSSDARARDEARRYLSTYPRGFAVKEARRLTDPP